MAVSAVTLTAKSRKREQETAISFPATVHLNDLHKPK